MRQRKKKITKTLKQKKWTIQNKTYIAPNSILKTQICLIVSVWISVTKLKFTELFPPRLACFGVFQLPFLLPTAVTTVKTVSKIKSAL